MIKQFGVTYFQRTHHKQQQVYRSPNIGLDEVVKLQNEIRGGQGENVS